MYLITKEQFIDIVKQETDNNGELTINFDKAIIDGSLVFKEGSWYGNLICIGTQYDYPIFTFTNQENLTTVTRPNENYLKTIIKGIQETYDHLNKEEITEYLITKQGIENNYSRENLIKLFDL